MKKFRVIWEIDVFSDNFEGAAKEALKIQRDPDSTATIFIVKPERGDPVEVDLHSGEVKHVERDSNA